MKFQLFQQMPDIDFVNKMLKCYGLENINDCKEFTKNDLIDNKTIDKLEDLIPELVLYYLPCKSMMYLNEININKSITILRQFLKLYNYCLKKREHVHNKKKYIFYHIDKINNKNIKINNDKDKCIVKFN